MASAAQNRRGIISMLGATSLFICNDALMKLAREAYPVGQALSLRTIFAVLTGLIFVFALRQGAALRLIVRPVVVLRSAIDAAVAMGFVWALGHIPIANITAIGLTSPLIIVVMAVVLGIETVGWRRALAVTVGFCGVLIVVRPGPEGFNVAALVALMSTVLVAARELITRSIGPDVPSTVVSLGATLLIGLTAICYGSFEDWQPAWRRETGYIAVAAILVSAGGLCVVNAFRNTDVSVIAGFRYSVVIFSLALGYLIWGEIPDVPALFGIVLIVGSGLYTMHRQSVRPDSNLKLGSGPQT